MFASPGLAGYGAVMRIAALLVLVVGCNSDGRDYPITTGGDDNPIHPMVDGAPVDGVIGDGATMLTGRVCLLTDLRNPVVASCAPTGAANITVQLGSETALTADDGSFMLLPPSGTGLVWRTSGTNLVPSVVPLTTSNLIPMISDVTYLDLQNSNSVIVNSGEGSAFVYVRQAGLALAGVTTTVKAPDASSFLPLGDTANATNWVQGATGNFGVSWTAGLAAGSPTLVLTPPAGSAVELVLPIEDGAITFATLAFP